MKVARWSLLFLLCVMLTVIAAGCGGSDDSTEASSTQSSDSTTPSSSEDVASEESSSEDASGKPFGTFRIVTNEIDSIDPALSQTVAGGGLAAQAWLPLVSYRRVNGPKSHELIPAIAESVPSPSSDGLTYEFKIRDISFADGQPVRPSDVKATIERMYKVNSPFVGHLSIIKGAEQFEKTKKGEIPGIVADDKAGTVTFQLTQPSGSFLNVLAGPGILPASTPAKDLSTSSPLPPPTGPMKIESYKPNDSYLLVKNESYEPIDGIPASNVDRIEGSVVSDPSVALQRTIDGEADYNQVALPPGRLGDLQASYPDQFKLYNTPSTDMFFFNQSKAPFNDLKARQAVNYAIDRDAMVKLVGGLGTPTENILPPSYTSYEKIDPYEYNLDKAKSLIEEAGLSGTKVRVIGSADERSRPVVTYLADQLRKIGLSPELKIFSPSVYFGVGGTKSTEADTGWDPWNEDIPHPDDWFSPLFDGSALKATGNTNWGFVNIPEVNKTINELSQPPLSEVTDQYAELDRRLVEDDSAIAPYMNPAKVDFFGPDVDTSCYVQLAQYRLDITQVCAN